jgi:hypothetical protein
MIARTLVSLILAISIVGSAFAQESVITLPDNLQPITVDNAAANAAAGLLETPDGFTWHHHQDGTTMMLVPNNIHRRITHSGGFVIVTSSGQ